MIRDERASDEVLTAEAIDDRFESGVDARRVTRMNPVAPRWRGFWGRLLRTRAARLSELTWAIRTTPDAPSNYLLRAELLRAAGERDAAIADYRRALALADAELQTRRWGILAQDLRDRAASGLRDLGITDTT